MHLIRVIDGRFDKIFNFFLIIGFKIDFPYRAVDLMCDLYTPLMLLSMLKRKRANYLHIFVLEPSSLHPRGDKRCQR